MFFALVVTVCSGSLGSNALEAHPRVRLLTEFEVQSTDDKVTLVDLEHRLDVELHRTSPFLASGLLFGAAGLHVVVGTVFVFLLPKLLWIGLIFMSGFFAVGAVLLFTAIGMSVAGRIQQARREKSVKALREEIERMKSMEPPSEPLPPPGVQNIPLVTPRLVLAEF